MRTSIVGIVAFSLLTTFGSTAFADDTAPKPAVTQTKKKKKAPAKKQVVEAKEPEVEAAASEPVLTLDSGAANAPPPAPAPTTTTTSALYEDKIGVDRPSASAPKPQKSGVDATGLVLSTSLLAMAPVTPLVTGDKTPTAGVGIEVRVGGYFSEHVGITGGLRLSGGHMLCHSGADLCNGVAVQVPLVLEIAQARNNGLYGEIGVGFLTAYNYTQDSSTMRIWTPAVLKTGLGYRIGNLAKGDLERKLAIDIRFNGDIGKMTNFSFENFTDIEGSGNIPDPAMYVSVGLSVGAHFSL